MAAFTPKSFDEIAANYEPGELAITFDTFIDQLQGFFLCSAVLTPLAQQIAILKFRGGEHIKKALAAADPQLANTDTMAAHIDAIKLYFEPAYTPIFCAYKMNQMTQHDEESIDDYVERLSRVSKSTSFTPDEREKEIIRSIALNTRNQKLAAHILAQLVPKLPDILKKARILEKLDGEIKSIKKVSSFSSTRHEDVNAVFAPPTVAQSYETQATSCGNCGHSHGPKERCIATDKECFNCGRKGHLSRMCRKPRKQQQQSAAQGYFNQRPQAQFNSNQQYRPVQRQQQGQFRSQSSIYSARPYLSQAVSRNFNEANFMSQNTSHPIQYSQPFMMVDAYGQQYMPQHMQQQQHFETPQVQQYIVQQQRAQLPEAAVNSISPHMNDMYGWDQCHQDSRDPNRLFCLIKEELLNAGSVDEVSPDVKRALRRVNINGHYVHMMLDTGASVNVINTDTLESLQYQPRIIPCDRLTFGYNSNKPLDMIGEFEATISTKRKSTIGRIQVLKGTGRNILGLAAAEALGLVIIPDEEVNTLSQTESWVQRFPKLFSSKVGLIKDVSVQLNINPDVKPVVAQLRRLPYHDVIPVTQELKSMLAQDILEVVPPFTPMPWVSQMMIVKKKDGSPRVCIDSRSINTAIEMEYFIMPTIEDIRYQINGARLLSKIDLNKAYFQLQLHPNSRYITAFITPLGVLRYKCMFMGMNTASFIFQRVIKNLLSGLEGVINVSDDILVFGSETTHDSRLLAVLDRLQEQGATAGIDKCKIKKLKIKFFGMMFSGQGMAPTRDRVRALVMAKQPCTPGEVRSILGSVNFSGGFIKDLALLAEPLRAISREGTVWTWGEPQAQAWEKIKHSLSTKALAHFNINWFTQIVVDASPIGLGAILQQVNPNDSNDTRVINFASRVLTDVEKRYPHIEKEAKACVYGCEKHHLYIAGAKFTLITDNKPVEMLFGNPQSHPSARIQKMAIRLAPYQFKIIHKPGYYNEADFFSRQPLANNEQYEDEDDYDSDDEYENEIMESQINEMVSTNIPSCVSKFELIQATLADVELQAVKLHLINNTKMIDSLQAFQAVREELTVTNDGLVIRQHRVVIPSKLQNIIIKQAHAGHQGQTKTLKLLATATWFPAARKMVDVFISQCKCQAETARVNPPPLRMTPLPSAPMEEVSTDFYSVSNTGVKLCTIICQYSRFPFVIEFTKTTAAILIPKLIQIFNQFGYPRRLRSDNGPPFQSQEFSIFLKSKGIIHILTIPASPNCNGQCENFNKVINKVIRVAKLEQRPWRTVLEEALLSFRSTPHSSTGYPPATLMFNRQVRGLLPIMDEPAPIDISQMHAEVMVNDQAAKATMKRYADERRHAKEHSFQVGDLVRVLQAKHSKLDTKFSGAELRVEKVDGVKIIATRLSDNVIITRHASQFSAVFSAAGADKCPVGKASQPQSQRHKQNISVEDIEQDVPYQEPILTPPPTQPETPVVAEVEEEFGDHLLVENQVENFVNPDVPPAPEITSWLQAARAFKKADKLQVRREASAQYLSNKPVRDTIIQPTS